jgi:hypothetical protein
LHFIPNVYYGTERYPERAARRLRGVNLLTWIAAATVGFKTGHFPTPYRAPITPTDPVPSCRYRHASAAGWRASAFVQWPKTPFPELHCAGRSLRINSRTPRNYQRSYNG